MVDLGKAMRSKVAHAVEKAPKLGLSNIEWDCSLVVMPTPVGPQPVYAVVLRTPSMILGEKLTGVAMIGDLDSDQEEVIRVLTDSFNGLREAKAKSGAISNGKGPHIGGGGQVG
jgi:hypothetical protein